MNALISYQTIASAVHKKLNELFGSEVDLDIRDHIFVKESCHTSALAETITTAIDGTAFISVRFDPSLYQVYKDLNCPTQAMSHHNIGLYSVIAEEVSHFSLLCTTAHSDTSISRFDLELQSEFDKYFVAAHLLQDQCGSPHTHALARMIFDSSVTYADSDIYDVTGSIAAKWWWNKVNRYGDNLINMHEMTKLLKEIRGSQGEAKLNLVRATSEQAFKKSA